MLGEVGEMVSTRAAFRITHRGRPTKEWEPVDSLMTDATGNVYGYSKWNQEVKAETVRVQLAGGLPGREAAWKLRVGFGRRATARFAPDESWTVRRLAVPVRGQSISTELATVRKGATLRLLDLSWGSTSRWP
jgi:hypothetical protein